jgi:hypothetical protein
VNVFFIVSPPRLDLDLFSSRALHILEFLVIILKFSIYWYLQSQERGITLDLQFSAVETPSFLITLTDCPGHASLIRTIIGGSFLLLFLYFYLFALS